MRRFIQAGRPSGRVVRVALVALALGGVALLATSGAQARPPGGGCRGKGDGFGIERLERKVPRLALAPETERAVYAAIDGARTARRSLDREIQAAHERMRTLLDQDRPAVEEVLAQADSLGTLLTEMRKADLRAMVAVRALLSPQQWEKLHERHWEGQHRGEAAPGA